MYYQIPIIHDEQTWFDYLISMPSLPPSHTRPNAAMYADSQQVGHAPIHLFAFGFSYGKSMVCSYRCLPALSMM